VEGDGDRRVGLPGRRVVLDGVVDAAVQVGVDLVVGPVLGGDGQDVPARGLGELAGQPEVT
jgi:hypothetical protein